MQIHPEPIGSNHITGNHSSRVGSYSSGPTPPCRMQTFTRSSMEDDTETIELLGVAECNKLVRELCYQIAKYRHSIIVLGGIQDSESLRYELILIRKRAHEMVKQTKAKILPHLKSNFSNYDRPAFERMWNTIIANMELLEQLMRKSLEIQRLFPHHSGPRIMIETGLSWSATRLQDELPTIDKCIQEQEEITAIMRDIHDAQLFLVEMGQCVDVKPWDISSAHIKKQDDDDSKRNVGNTELIAFPDYDRRKRKRRICIAAGVGGFVLCAIALTVCLTQFIS